MSMRKKSAKGFTLIELLVVMAIIGVLLTMVMPRYVGTLERSRETALKQDLAVMREAIANFHHDLNRYPENLDELVQKKYLRSVPVDPVTDRNDTWISVPSADPSDQGMADIGSGAKGETRDGVSFQEL
jgi:general secretion pathway protein G